MKKLYSFRTTTKVVATTYVSGLLLSLFPSAVHAQGCASPSFSAATNYNAGTQQTNAVALGDVNGDGKTDMVASYMFGVLVYINNGSGGFNAPTTLTGGAGDPFFVVIRDLNADGRPDIATANEGGANASVYLNTGSGNFASGVNYATGRNPFVVRAADLNGDGRPDLVVGNHGSDNTVSVLFNAGSGTFSAATNYSGMNGPADLVLRDFNGDGKIDMAVVNEYSNVISLYFNNGTGSFSGPTNYATGSDPLAIDAADLNNDGKIDIAVANNGANTVSVFFNSGTGTFSAPVNYAVGTNPEGVGIGDLNGDGKPDLAVSNSGSNNLSILLNNGTGSFGTPTNFALGTVPTVVAIGDINGDLKADIAVPNYTSHNISVLTNTCSASNYVLLPVQITSFKAAEQNGNVQLDWTVAEEQGINRYEVERSTTGENFQKIGEVTATRKTAYNFPDQSPAPGKDYYRLRIVENDGSYRYSTIAVLTIGGSKASVAVYPNPVSDHRLGLQLMNQPKGLFTLRLYNNLGQEVMNKRINHETGSSFETIILPSGIGKGMYRAVLETANGKKNFDIIVE